MSQNQNRLNWNIEKGTVMLSRDGEEERVFLMSRDFLESFKDEMINTAGKATFKMIVRKLMVKLDISPDDAGGGGWEVFETYNDRRILPVSVDGLNIPEDFEPWDGSSRELILKPDIPMTVWTVHSFQVFKEVLAEIMTEKGAIAMLNSAGKKAGMAVGERFIRLFGWKGINSVLDTFDKVIGRMTAIQGWARSSSMTSPGGDGNPMLYIKAYQSFESHEQTSTRPVCVITASFLNGTWNAASGSLDGHAAEAREVKCTAKGDDYCGFAIKLKKKGTPPLDWKELEAEWQAIDAG